MKKIRKNRNGISAIIVSLIILAVSLGMAVAYASMMMGWFGGASVMVKIDTSDTKIIQHPSTGYTKIQVVIRNLGTATIKISNILIDMKNAQGNVTFLPSLTFILKQENIEIVRGKIYGSSSSVVVNSEGKLVIPPGESATLFGEIVDGRNYWEINEDYRGTIFYERGVKDFKYTVESY